MDLIKIIKNIGFKLLLALVFGVINSVAFCPSCFSNPQEPNDRVILYYSLAFLLTYEIIALGVRLIGKRFDWIKEQRKVIIANILWMLLIYVPLNYIAVELNFRHHPDRFNDAMIYFLKLNNFLLALILICYFNMKLFFNSWKESKRKEQELKEHEIKHELKALKNQINPHFLFNNLNTLSHLVKEDSNLAEQYIYQLSKVYRYLLEQKNADLVIISKEYEALKALIYILEVKHEKNLTFKIDEKHFNQYKVATFTLQMLVENALKHNVIDHANQLNIEIFIDNKHLIIRNNITKQPTVAFSSGIGLKNIINRYQLISEKLVDINENENFFTVKIPLL